MMEGASAIQTLVVCLVFVCFGCIIMIQVNRYDQKKIDKIFYIICFIIGVVIATSFVADKIKI